MRNKKGSLRRAERKVKLYHKHEWCGYLTPSEARAIIDDGAQPHRSSTYQRDNFQELKDKGDCEPSWFYFYPSVSQKKRWM